MQVNKHEFDQQKRLLWVYLRHGGECAICGSEVNPNEIATDPDARAPLGTDAMLQVRLLHPFCKAVEARRTARPVAA